MVESLISGAGNNYGLGLLNNKIGVNVKPMKLLLRPSSNNYLALPQRIQKPNYYFLFTTKYSRRFWRSTGVEVNLLTRS